MIKETCECVFKLQVDPTGATIVLIFLAFVAIFGGYFIISHIDEIDHDKQSGDRRKKNH